MQAIRAEQVQPISNSEPSKPAKLSEARAFGVYKSISCAMAEIAQDGIQKNNRNKQQGWNFRGIDDIYNAISRILPRHNLVIMPEVMGRKVVERPTKNGGLQSYVTLKVRYDFINTEDGSKHSVTVYGEAMDAGDKATSKAMSAAYKYACFQVFCIPTEGDNDADNNAHEFANSNHQQPQQSPQQQIQQFQQPDHFDQSHEMVNHPVDQGYDYAPARVPVVDRSRQSPQAQKIQAMADEMKQERRERREQEDKHRRSVMASDSYPPQGHPAEQVNDGTPVQRVLLPYQVQAIYRCLETLNMSEGHLCNKIGVGKVGYIREAEYNRVIQWLNNVADSKGIRLH